MWIWLLAITIKVMGKSGKHWLAEAESATAHCMARLYLSGGEEIWKDLSYGEWKHSALVRFVEGKIPPLDRPQGPDFAPGFNRLLCWRIWVGSPFHELQPDQQLAVAAYFEDAQARFYRALAKLSLGAERQIYKSIASQEQGHAAMFPAPCPECRKREGRAIAAMIFWDLPRILTGRFTYFLGK